jgi:Mg/Co/Ni transporter MgtE
MRQFGLRDGERLLAGELIGKRLKDEQVKLVEGLDLARLARVLDEMEADDAADLLGEFSAGRQAELLHAMDPERPSPSAGCSATNRTPPAG